MQGRLFGLYVAFAAVFAVSGAASGAPAPTTSSLEHQKRSALLSLYSLDSRLSAAQVRLDSLRGQARTLRAERASLATQLHVARIGARASQHRLAERLRDLYDGSTSSVEILLGATSFADVLTQLDNLNHVATLNSQLVTQLRSARVRVLRTKQQLAGREARLEAAIRAATAETRRLEGVRSERAAYVAQLSYRQAQIARLDERARAAETKARELTQAPPAAALAEPAPAGSGNALTVVSTGYCLTGTTATGIPVGWGVAAVDPRVIPLGTHLTIPGYGTAVAADTGGAIVGNRIDLWFPSCGQAGGWGSRSVTIALH